MHPNRLGRVIPGLPVSMSHMLYVCALSFRICEQCFKYCVVGREVARVCLSRSRSLCSSKEHPESVPSALQHRYRDATDLTLKYGRVAVRAVRFYSEDLMTHLKESDVLGFSRRRFGGDIGLAARYQPACDSLSKCNGRQYMYHSRMILVTAGVHWADHTVHGLSEALGAAMVELSVDDS
ncbi:hypothetical protein BG000_001095 [Podila horticola]|nr:hypothetical protein BG000_001095 [Podila horticola]